jgi:hypothetical protein
MIAPHQFPNRGASPFATVAAASDATLGRSGEHHVRHAPRAGSAAAGVLPAGRSCPNPGVATGASGGPPTPAVARIFPRAAKGGFPYPHRSCAEVFGPDLRFLTPRLELTPAERALAWSIRRSSAR